MKYKIIAEEFPSKYTEPLIVSENLQGRKRSYIVMVLFCIISVSIGLILPVVLYNDEIKTWYPTIKSPPFTPYNWILPPVLTTLYIIIGLSGYFIWEINNSFHSKYFVTWITFAMQFILSFAWSPIFFGLHSLFFASVDQIIMDLVLIFNIVQFYKIEPRFSRNKF